MPESRFVLVSGVSGVGKTSVIREMVREDDRFRYISPYTTRQLRQGESDKIHVSSDDMEQMQNDGMFLAVNQIYGVTYGTPIEPIRRYLDENKYPVLDWPIDKKEVVVREFGKRAMLFYILPPSIETLRQRIGNDDRDP
jgi:guanylate kinase